MIVHLLNLILLFNIAGAHPSYNEEYLACVTKFEAKWGEDCSQCKYMTDTYTVFFRNECDVNLDIKVAVQEEDLYWKTFTFLNTEPGQEISGYACKGTGKYQYWVRKTGDKSIQLPTDEFINSRRVRGN